MVEGQDECHIVGVYCSPHPRHVSTAQLPTSRLRDDPGPSTLTSRPHPRPHPHPHPHPTLTAGADDLPPRFLVKWRSLPYANATWESCRTLLTDQSAISRFHAFE